MIDKNKTENKGSAPRVILGIDPGTGRVGWAVLDLVVQEKKLGKGKEMVLKDYGCLETVVNTPLPERLEYIYKEVNRLIAKFKPNELAIEELFFVKNIKTGMSVAHARGVVILAAKQNKLKIFEYKPNEIKLSIAGYGHATKDQIRRMLKLHLKGCNIKQDDAADAVAVALCHLSRPKIYQ